MNEYLNFKTKQGKPYVLAVPPPGPMKSFFAFSLYKAGSTLLFDILASICTAKDIPMINLFPSVFSQGLSTFNVDSDVNILWKEEGYAYLGFRHFPAVMDFDLGRTRNVLLVRDPKDILVSLYFSLKYSHSIPKGFETDHPIVRQREKLQDEDINDFVWSRRQILIDNFQEYMDHLIVTTRIYRYEDVIFRKREWIADMLDFLEISLPKEKI